MREIKFRAWIPNWKMMFYSDHICMSRVKTGFEYYPAAILLDNGKQPPDDMPNTDNIILMQYTGLKDKNGREIYEGDIVRGGWDSETPRLVEFIEGGFEPFSRHTGEAGEWYGGVSVIGNIYENAELLEAKI